MRLLTDCQLRLFDLLKDPELHVIFFSAVSCLIPAADCDSWTEQTARGCGYQRNLEPWDQNKISPIFKRHIPFPRAARFIGRNDLCLLSVARCEGKFRAPTQACQEPVAGPASLGRASGIPGSAGAGDAPRGARAGRPAPGRASGVPPSFPFPFFRLRSEEFKLTDSAGTGRGRAPPHPATGREAGGGSPRSARPCSALPGPGL